MKSPLPTWRADARLCPHAATVRLDAVKYGTSVPSVVGSPPANRTPGNAYGTLVGPQQRGGGVG